MPTTRSGDDLQAGALGLLEWVGIDALGGILATSVIAVSFYLLYSRFYLVIVGGAALVHPPAAGVVLIIPAGLAQLLRRVLL